MLRIGSSNADPYSSLEIVRSETKFVPDSATEH